MLVIISSFETLNEVKAMGYSFIAFFASVKLLDLLHDSSSLEITVQLLEQSQNFNVHLAITKNSDRIDP